MTWSFTAHSPTKYFDNRTAMVRKLADASFVACVSYDGRSQLMAKVPAQIWPKLHVVRCGVDANTYQAEGRNPSSPPLILTVARLHADKGHAVLLQALARLRAEGVDFQAAFVGDGPERKSLESLTTMLGLEIA